MPKPTMPRITEFLTGRPNGATVRKITELLHSSTSSVVQTLRLMQSRGQLVILIDSSERDDMVWALANSGRPAAPPIFRAVETLAAMQDAAREQLMAQSNLEVA